MEEVKGGLFNLWKSISEYPLSEKCVSLSI